MKSIIILICILCGTCFASIRVGYVLTQSAALKMLNTYGGYEGIFNCIVASHAQLNESYIKSGFAENDPDVSAVLGYIRLDTTCNNDTICANLNHFCYDSTGTFDYIFKDKIAYNIDIMILVSDYYWSGWCGYVIAYAPTPNGWPDFVNAAIYWPCLLSGGQTYLGHEIAHIIGARHHIQLDPSNTVIDGDTFTYVHGFCSEGDTHWVDILVQNYTCPYKRGWGNYYSDPDSLDWYSSKPRGDTTYADIVRFFSEKFYRYTNLHPIPPTRDWSDSSVKFLEFRDVVATGDITASNDYVPRGGGLQLRSNTGIYITPGINGFHVDTTGYLRVVAGGNEPLAKRGFSAKNSFYKKRISDAILKNIVHTFTRNNNIIISYSLGGQQFNDVDVQLFDLQGRSLYKKVSMPSKNTLFFPISYITGKSLIMCLRKKNQTIMTRRLVKGICQEW